MLILAVVLLTIVLIPSTLMASEVKLVLSLEDSPYFCSTFEIKSSFYPIPITQTHQLNKWHRTRCILERLEVVVPMEEDISITYIYPFFV